MKAIILCAGKGTRFKPFSLVKPKPLFEVGGISLIERTILQLHEQGITDIAVVTGYKHEEFLFLKEQYSVEMYISTEYDTKNNFSSLQLVKHRLNDSLIIDADLYFERSVVPFIEKGKSQFICQKFENGNDWALEYGQDLRINKVRKWEKTGYLLTGVSYWTGEGASLLAAELENCSDDDYWEDAAIRILDKTPIYITKIPQFSIEIDSLHDALQAKLVTANEIATQCSTLLPEKLKGLTNNTYKILLNEEETVLRIPGEHTEKIINRSHEEHILQLLDGHNITPKSAYYAGGIKTLPFLHDYRVFDKETLSVQEVKGLAHTLRTMHSINIKNTTVDITLSMYEETLLYEKLTQIRVLDQDEQNFMYKVAKELDNSEAVLCHRDLLLENIMTNGKDIQLIDFEYACFTSPYWDIVSFLTESRIEGTLRTAFLEAYGDLDMKKVLEAEILIDYIWGLWGFYQQYYAYARGRISMCDVHLKKYSTMYALK